MDNNSWWSRRQFVAGVSGIGLLGTAGCIGEGDDGAMRGGPTKTPTDSPSTTESEGLPDEPGEDPGTADAEFTENVPATPIPANRFTEAYNEQLREKDLRTGWATKVREDETDVKISYVASEDNQEERLHAFAESYVEVVARTGGTGWDMRFEVQVSGGDVWYYWEIQEQWAIDRLSGAITENEFYNRVRDTTEKP